MQRLSRSSRVHSLFGLAALFLASSCVIVSDSNHDISGSFVSKSTLSQIEPGATKTYVKTLLGEPSTQTSVDEFTEVWRWTYTEERASSAKVFLIVSDTNRSRTERSTFVEFVDGVVSKSWRD